MRRVAAHPCSLMDARKHSSCGALRRRPRELPAVPECASELTFSTVLELSTSPIPHPVFPPQVLNNIKDEGIIAIAIAVVMVITTLGCLPDTVAGKRWRKWLRGSKKRPLGFWFSAWSHSGPAKAQPSRIFNFEGSRGAVWVASRLEQKRPPGF